MRDVGSFTQFAGDIISRGVLAPETRLDAPEQFVPSIFDDLALDVMFEIEDCLSASSEAFPDIDITAGQSVQLGLYR